jgi:peptide/nickel transport system substrate-binding protein
METNETIHRMLGKRRTSRRDFIRDAVALGLSATAASALWSKTAKATPQSGGHLKAGVSGANAADSLDPTTFSDTFMLSVGFSIRDNLTAIASDNSVEGAAAESWEPSADATKWVFNLRKGVEFSNGKSLEAGDVIASINQHRGEDTKSGAKGVVAAIDDIVADGKDKVVFKLKSGDADFPYILSDYHLNILPNKDGEVDWRSGVGSGAYILEEFQPGIRAILKRNPNRWQQEIGFVESAELVAVNDANARQTALVSGELDAINKPDLKTIHFLKQSKAVQVVDVPGRLWHAAIMQVNAAPFDDNNLRMALKYGIDREEYLQKVLKGYGTLGNDNPIGQAFRYHAADIPQRKYDPDKARYHLKKSGHANTQLNLHTGELFPGAVSASELYQHQAEKAGLDIKLVRHPADGYWSEVWNVLPFTWVWWGPRITEDLILSLAFLGSSSWNDTRIDIDRLNKLIVGARAELDDKKRAEMYREVQLIIRDEGGDVVPAFANLLQAVSDKVGVPKDDSGNWKIAGSWEMDGGHFIKRWWLA